MRKCNMYLVPVTMAKPICHKRSGRHKEELLISVEFDFENDWWVRLISFCSCQAYSFL